MPPNCRKICILSTWAEQNNMEFNASKFELLRYGNNAELKQSTHYTSNVGTVIEEKSQTKDLGVIMSTTAHFASHIESVADTVRDLSAWILRSFRNRSKTSCCSYGNQW